MTSKPGVSSCRTVRWAHSLASKRGQERLGAARCSLGAKSEVSRNRTFLASRGSFRAKRPPQIARGGRWSIAQRGTAQASPPTLKSNNAAALHTSIQHSPRQPLLAVTSIISILTVTHHPSAVTAAQPALLPRCSSHPSLRPLTSHPAQVNICEYSILDAQTQTDIALGLLGLGWSSW